MMKGYEKGGMADKMGRAMKRKTSDAKGRAMPKMSLGGLLAKVTGRSGDGSTSKGVFSRVGDEMRSGERKNPRGLLARTANAVQESTAMKKGGMAKKRGK